MSSLRTFRVTDFKSYRRMKFNRIKKLFRNSNSRFLTFTFVCVCACVNFQKKKNIFEKDVCVTRESFRFRKLRFAVYRRPTAFSANFKNRPRPNKTTTDCTICPFGVSFSRRISNRTSSEAPTGTTAVS